MSSLVTTASVWTSDSPNRKRTSSLRRTVKAKPDFAVSAATATAGSTVAYANSSSKKPFDEEDGEGEGEDYISEKENYQNMMAASMDNTQSVQNERASRVNDILNEITSVDSHNENNKMGTFKPLPNPSYELKKDVNDNSMIIDSHSYPMSFEMPTYSQAGNSFKQPGGGGAGSNPVQNNKNKARYASNVDTGNLYYSNYQRSYDPSTVQYRPNMPGYVVTNSNGGGGVANQPPAYPQIDGKLMEKINYMIRLLEEQQVEKTSHITEEFILYSFLGVFMIFIVDSFSRSGKYIR